MTMMTVSNNLRGAAGVQRNPTSRGLPFRVVGAETGQFVAEFKTRSAARAWGQRWATAHGTDVYVIGPSGRETSA